MNSSTKLATAFAVLATMSLPAAYAQKKSDEWTLKKPKLEKPTTSINWSGAFDYATNSFQGSVDDLENFDDLGEKIRIRDLNLSVDVLMSIFGARLTLEENSNDLSIDGTSLKEKVRDLYVGIQPMENLIILYGKTDVPFGADQSERAENEVTKLNEQLERKLVAAVEIHPTFMKQIQSVELAAFSSKSDRNDVKFNDKLDSYAARVIADIAGVLTQASYMRMDGKEYRASISGAKGVASKITGPLQVYAELQMIRESAINGDINVATVGASKQLEKFGNGKTSVYAEGSRIQQHGTSKNARNAGAVGAKYRLNKNVTLGAEVSTHGLAPEAVISQDKDTTVSASVEVKKGDRAKRAPMFGKKRDADGSDLRAKAAKMRAK